MSGPIVGVIGFFVMFAVLFVLRIPAAFTMMIVGFLGVSLRHLFQGGPRDDRP